MLETCDAADVILQAWEKLGCAVELPEQWSNFLERRGLTPIKPDDRRSSPRFHCAGRALLRLEGKLQAIYVKDISRSGIAILTSRQLFPKQGCSLILTSDRIIQLTIVRCRRVGKNCYECGARIITREENTHGQAENSEPPAHQ